MERETGPTPGRMVVMREILSLSTIPGIEVSIVVMVVRLLLMMALGGTVLGRRCYIP